MAAEYNALSKEEIDNLVREAAVMNMFRESAKDRPLGEMPVAAETEEAHLRPSQLHRLNQCRLDTSLDRVIQNPTWQEGLALSDHICALRASFVKEFDQLSKKEDSTLEEEILKDFLYDPTVNDNVAAPLFSRPCLWTFAGTCEKDHSFDVTMTLVDQLDKVLTLRKLATRHVLLHLEVEESSASASSASTAPRSPSAWFLLGCMTKRPLTHIGIRVCPVGESRFAFKVVNNIPCVESSHRCFQKLLREYESQNRIPDATLKVSWPLFIKSVVIVTVYFLIYKKLLINRQSTSQLMLNFSCFRARIPCDYYQLAKLPMKTSQFEVNKEKWSGRGKVREREMRDVTDLDQACQVVQFRSMVRCLTTSNSPMPATATCVQQDSRFVRSSWVGASTWMTTNPKRCKHLRWLVLPLVGSLPF